MTEHPPTGPQTVPPAYEAASIPVVGPDALQGTLDTVPPVNTLALALQRRRAEIENGTVTYVGHDAIIHPQNETVVACEATIWDNDMLTPPSTEERLQAAADFLGISLDSLAATAAPGNAHLAPILKRRAVENVGGVEVHVGHDSMMF